MLRIFAAKKTLSLPAEFCRDKHDLILCRSRSVVSKRRGMAATEGAARWPEGRYDDGVWDIGRARGFLPARDPARALTAPQFAALQALLDATPGTRADGTPGLLATPGAIRGPVEALPNLLAAVQATQSRTPVRCWNCQGIRTMGEATLAETWCGGHIGSTR